jgi:hypothetical protein
MKISETFYFSNITVIVRCNSVKSFRKFIEYTELHISNIELRNLLGLKN